jgi:predicted MFS family arabinose efflux permease
MTTECLSSPSAVRASFPARMGPRLAFAVNAVVSIAFLAASSAPTPLYAIYQEHLHLTPLIVTVVFASYAIALLIALLVVGSLSDHLGRRTVILGALALETVAMIVFAVSSNAAELISARALQGLATGAATAALGAGLADLIPRRAPLVNSVAPIIGMAVGALGSAALTTAVAVPTTDVFIVLMILFALLFVTALFLPESVERRPGALRSLKISAVVPPAARRALVVATPILIAVWAMGGFILSLGPSLARAQTGSTSPMVGGWLVFALTFSGAIAVFTFHRTPAARAFIIGAGALIAGVAVTLLGVVVSAPVLLFLGIVIAGIGFGTGFQGAMRTVLPLAQAGERAGLLATVYVISYLATSLPAIAAGLLSSLWGIKPAAIIIGSAVIILAAMALGGILRHSKAAS